MAEQFARPLVSVSESRVCRSTQHIDHSAEVACSIAALYGTEQLTDVTFLVQGVRFAAHRVVLAARSDYFRALLYGGMSESTSSLIHLNDISANSFRHILQYAYTGRLHVRKIRVLLDVLGLAHQYGFQSLEKALSLHLTHSLVPSNVWLIYSLAVLYNLDELINACLKFLDAIAPAPLHSPQFLTLSQTAVELLLSRDSFCAAEIEIFRSICAWFRAHTEVASTRTTSEESLEPHRTNELSETAEQPRDKEDVASDPADCAITIPNEMDEQRRQMMRTCVRFELISLADLLTEVRSSNLVSSDDLLDAIERQAKAVHELPHRGWLLPETNLATPRFACSLIAGEEGSYAHFFVDDDEHAGRHETQGEFRINLVNPNATSENLLVEDASDGIDGDDDSLSENASLSELPAATDLTTLDGATGTELNQHSAPGPAGLTLRPSGSHQTSDPQPNSRMLTSHNRHRPVGNQVIPSDTHSTHARSAQAGRHCSSVSSTNSANVQFNLSTHRWLKPNRHFNGQPFIGLPQPPPHSEYDVVRHSLDDPDAHIIIRLGKPSIVNTIRMQLWDRETRCYSYYVDVSLDQNTWTRVVDYRNHFCRSWQMLQFPTRVIRYVRVTGTRNTSNRAFHLVTFRCLYSEHVCKQLNGFLIPTYNVASVLHGATVLEGVSRNRNALIDGDARLYDWNSGYTCHQLGNGAIVVQLSQPYLLRSMRFLLWDLDDRFYSYSVHVATNREDWRLVRDATQERCQSWQVLTFPLQLVTFIRVVGSFNTANEVFHMVHLECPYLPAEMGQSDGDPTNTVVPGPPSDLSIPRNRTHNHPQPSLDTGHFELDVVGVRPPSNHSSARGSYSTDVLNGSATVELSEELAINPQQVMNSAAVDTALVDDLDSMVQHGVDSSDPVVINPQGRLEDNGRNGLTLNRTPSSSSSWNQQFAGEMGTHVSQPSRSNHNNTNTVDNKSPQSGLPPS